MNQARHASAAIAVVLTAAALLTGGAATQQSAPRDAAITTGPTISSAAGSSPSSAAAPVVSLKRPVSSGSSPAAPSLPASWPRDVPIPQGKLIGSTVSNGRWTVLLLEAGSAAQVLRSADAFYTAAGFTAVSASVLNKGNRHITLAVQNRDHSATKAYLVIQLTTP